MSCCRGAVVRPFRFAHPRPPRAVLPSLATCSLMALISFSVGESHHRAPFACQRSLWRVERRMKIRRRAARDVPMSTSIHLLLRSGFGWKTRPWAPVSSLPAPCYFGFAWITEQPLALMIAVPATMAPRYRGPSMPIRLRFSCALQPHPHLAVRLSPGCASLATMGDGVCSPWLLHIFSFSRAGGCTSSQSRRGAAI
jgi:hypothetical protein